MFRKLLQLNITWSMVKRCCCFNILFALIAFNANAQQNAHINFWGRISIAQPISEKWRAEAEFQHRRQNNYALNLNNALDEQLLTSTRLWVHYQHKDDISFSFSPFAYYWHSNVIIKEEDIEKPGVREVRISAAVDLKHELIKKLWLIDRTCVEHRNFQHQGGNYIRMRNRLGLRYEFNEKWNITLFEEIFLNLHGATAHHFFDHDRLALLVNYKPTSHWRIEAGYVFIKRLPKNTDEFLNENNYLLHLYYLLPHNEHRKHSKTQHHT